MKAEERHRLHHNALADGVQRLVEGVKTAPARQSLSLWLALGAVVVAVVAWQLYRSSSASVTSSLWLQFNDATHDAAQGDALLNDLDKKYAGTAAGRAARFQVARRKFMMGQENLDSSFDREEAIKNLKSARDLYAQLGKESSDEPLLIQEALMAVAKADEALAAVPDPDKAGEMCGSLDRALEAYQELAKKYPESPQGKAAAKRATDLKENRAEIDKFYTQLSEMLTTPPRPSPTNTLNPNVFIPPPSPPTGPGSTTLPALPVPANPSGLLTTPGAPAPGASAPSTNAVPELKLSPDSKPASGKGDGKVGPAEKPTPPAASKSGDSKTAATPPPAPDKKP
jgi:hypothetical protein